MLRCEFYPDPDELPICAAGSDVAGEFACTKEYSLTCQWANERREGKGDFGMTGDEIFRTLYAGLEMADSPEAKDGVNTFAHTQMLWLHARSLAAHCECLGMNAENSLAVCNGASSIPFSQLHYLQVLQKWGLMNEKGKPTI